MALGKIKADQLEHSTAGSVDTQFVVNGSAKAWVNFNGTGTIAARDSLNHSGLTDNGTGDYTASYTNSMGNANYVSFHIATHDSSNIGPSGETQSRATGSVEFECRYQGNNTVYDHLDCYVGIFGDLA